MEENLLGSSAIARVVSTKSAPEWANLLKFVNPSLTKVLLLTSPMSLAVFLLPSDDVCQSIVGFLVWCQRSPDHNGTEPTCLNYGRKTNHSDSSDNTRT